MVELYISEILRYLQLGMQVMGRKNVKSSDAKCNRQSGKSWAFELGSDVQVCPIVVDDLEDPGQMLIEV